MFERDWFGHRVRYVVGPDRCYWTRVSGRPIDLNVPWPPPTPEGMTCDHVVCRSYPAMHNDQIEEKFAEFLESIGAKPGTYKLTGEVQVFRSLAYSECILHITKEIK